MGKIKLDATTAPTPSDDTQQGYRVGSEWFDTENKRQYVCFDSTADEAVWVETTRTGIQSAPAQDSRKVVDLSVTQDGKLEVLYEA